MADSLKTSLDERISKLLDFPECDNKTLIIRKTIWTHTAGSLIAILCLTLGFIFFVPQLTILICYGVILFSVLISVLIISPFLRKNYNHLVIVDLTLMIVVSFIFILKLGGITNSAGLIFVGLSAVLSSIPLQHAKITLSLFSVYILTILIAGLAEPWLSLPEQLTPKTNAVIFLINTLWMSAYLLSIVLNFIEQQRLNDQLESKKLQEINEAKTKLFTNITHEFRTPLTVIQGMADLIEKSPEEWVKEGTSRIRSNGHVLLRLVNQMLDLARIESGSMPVRLVRGNVNAFMIYVTELFGSVARIREITLLDAVEREPFEMDYDPDKLLQILSNLLSNALKFTGRGEDPKVTSRRDAGDSMYTITVSDTGTGIAPEQLPHIFERFYQGHAKIGDEQGSGLGLFYVKELVELLNGRITVFSTPGKGTEFSVGLPVTRKAPPDTHIDPGKIEKQVVVYLAVQPEKLQTVSEEGISGSGLPLMLIVEDSADVSKYLGTILKNEYQIMFAENGSVGYEKAVNTIPDVILSDVMMPGMDGIEMLEKVKGDFRTSHIPVVMLTAKADVESRLEGLEKGADAYLAKPFSEKELHIVLKNLVEIRRKLHERYAVTDRPAESSKEEFPMEDTFMAKVRQVLEANLEDEEFGVSGLCRELAVSRTQLYRKFRSLSNRTLSDYFKILRLHKAKELLGTSDLNVTEVAITVGFKNLSHFSREFKSEFGKSPGEFRNGK